MSKSIGSKMKKSISGLEQKRNTEMVENEPRFVIHNSGELGVVTEYLGKGKYKTRKIFHIGESGVMCDDLKTFISWDRF